MQRSYRQCQSLIFTLLAGKMLMKLVRKMVIWNFPSGIVFYSWEVGETVQSLSPKVDILIQFCIMYGP
jgi:hypothetical protein